MEDLFINSLLAAQEQVLYNALLALKGAGSELEVERLTVEPMATNFAILWE